MKAALAVTLVALVGCAAHPGDELDCAECDNITELLVGNRCVPIEEVEACGPDGHAHGGECHCSSGQDPVEIAGNDYCLQPSCAEQHEHPEDPFAHACELLAVWAPKIVEPVTDFAEFGDAHAELGQQILVDLPYSEASYLHFPGHATGHVLLFLDRPGVLGRVLDADQEELASENLGADPACDDTVPEVWEIHVVNDSGGVQPQIVELNAVTADFVRLVVLEEGEEH